MFPYNYTVVGARNSPGSLSINAKSLSWEGDLLSLVAADTVPFLEPLEWWRVEVPGFDWDAYKRSGGEDWYELGSRPKNAAHVYGVKSSHAERLVQIHADSHEYDGESLWLLLNREIEAVFNRPVEWKRKEFTNPKRAYTDDEL